MRHDPYGHWLANASPPEPVPPLADERSADVVVVGGGFTGLWAAWWISVLAPGASVVLLEAGRCGHGPSGRNGGFANGLWTQAHELRRRFGDAAARDLLAAAAGSVDEIGAFCQSEKVDARFRRGGYMRVSTAPAQDGAWREAASACADLGLGAELVELSAADARRHCDSPLFRGGMLARGGASVDPARLALGLRDRAAGRGVRIFEESRALALRDGAEGVEVRTAGGSVRARRAVVAVGAATPALSPLARRLTIASSHIVLTEPVPDALEELDWTGGECISDCRTFLHYFRTTPDARVLFGYAGGRMAAGARAGGRIEVDPWAASEAEREMRRLLPPLADARIERAWGGPIDVSPTHLPWVGSLPGGSAFYAAGFTGNGVGPSELCGRVLASLALDRTDAHSRLAIVDPDPVLVPPEPIRFAGGALVREAFLRAEAAEDEGRSPGPLIEFVRRLPERLGIRIGR